MYLKYLISGFDDAPIGMKYEICSGRFIIGGNPRHKDIMDSIIQDYFERKIVPRQKIFARNKIRMEFDMPSKKFYEGLDRLKSCGIHVSQVQTHGRLMR